MISIMCVRKLAYVVTRGAIRIDYCLDKSVLRLFGRRGGSSDLSSVGNVRYILGFKLKVSNVGSPACDNDV